MDASEFYVRIGELVSTMPDLEGDDWATADGRKWMARMAALLDAEGGTTDAIKFKVACDGLGVSPLHASNINLIIAASYRALARAELAAPPGIQGTYIPVGAAFTALAAVSKIVSSATSSVLIVDPYADAMLLTEFGVLITEKITLKILSDSGYVKPGLQPAAKTWVQQYGPLRPLEVRLASAKTLHDRLIIVDERDVFSVGQSFNGLAKRAPTSFLRADKETAQLKSDAYKLAWQSATQVV